MSNCERHGGQNIRPDLDRVMRQLPESQAGDGRHRCTYCAYQEGYRQALDDVRDQLRRLDNDVF